MSRIRSLLNTAAQDFHSGIRRFYVASCLSLIAFILIEALILGDFGRESTELVKRILLSAAVGAGANILLRLMYERYESKIIRLINLPVTVICVAVVFGALQFYIDNVYVTAGVWGILAAVVIMAFFYSNKLENNVFGLHFAYVFKVAAIASAVSLIINIGLILAFSAFHFLVHEFRNFADILSAIIVFSFELILFNIFLVMLPKGEEDYRIPKIFKILVLNIALPVYLLLILVLYIYLGKIIVTWNFPAGQLNWYASFASLFGILFYLSVKQYEHISRFAKTYLTVFGYMILPVILMQCISVYIRFAEYGLTPVRYISMVLILISVIFAVLSVIKGGRFSIYILPVMAVFAVLVTIGPSNLIDVPAQEQEARLISVLEKNNMYKDGVIISNQNIEAEDRKDITSAYYALQISKSDKLKLKQYYGTNNNFSGIFGFEEEGRSYGSGGRKYRTAVAENPEFDILGYSVMLPVSYENYKASESSSVVTFTIGQTDFRYDFAEYIGSLNKEGYESKLPKEKQEIMLAQDIKICIASIDYITYDQSEQIGVAYINGYILKK